ncbi:MAG: acyl-CoA dehydrogenase family protein [bacterium]
MSVTEDIRSFRELAERFAGRELEAGAVDRDNYPFVEFNRAALDAAQETGLLSVMLPEDLGGVGQGIAALCEVLMPIAQADASFAALVFMNTLSQAAVVEWGTKEIKEKYVNSVIGLPAYDLPHELQEEVAAERTGEGFRLSGRVEYVVPAPVADALIVPAVLSGTGKVGLFLIDAGAEGVKVGGPVLSLGLRGCPAADVELQNAGLPAHALLCDDANERFPALAARFRPALAALSTGVCEGSFQAAKAYAKERYQGGRMIINYDMVRQMLANLAVAAESGKALVRQMAEAAEQGRPWPLSDAGHIMAAEQAARAAGDGVQVLGGYGYMEDYGQEKRMRDAKQIANILGAPPAKRLRLMEEIIRQEE